LEFEVVFEWTGFGEDDGVEKTRSTERFLLVIPVRSNQRDSGIQGLNTKKSGKWAKC
jgi:hypothetical protein